MGTLDENSDHAEAVGDDLQAKRDLSHPEHDRENLERRPGPFQDRICEQHGQPVEEQNDKNNAGNGQLFRDVILCERRKHNDCSDPIGRHNGRERQRRQRKVCSRRN